MSSRLFATALALFFMMAPAVAQERPEGPPTGRITIEQINIAFIGSAALGGGTLTYQGQDYPISVSGLGVGGFGASRLTASGDIYGLRSAGDLAGVYTQIRTGWALGASGSGTMWLTNNRVTMKLHAHRRGLQLTLGADGVVIAFK
jgi:hypothetical protein